MQEVASCRPSSTSAQIHGRVSWAVKSIWEYYATWFHFDATTELYHGARGSAVRARARRAGRSGRPRREARPRTWPPARPPPRGAAPPRGGHCRATPPIGAPSLETRQGSAREPPRAGASRAFQNTYEIDWLKLPDAGDRRSARERFVLMCRRVHGRHHGADPTGRESEDPRGRPSCSSRTRASIRVTLRQIARGAGSAQRRRSPVPLRIEGGAARRDRGGPSDRDRRAASRAAG